MFSLAIDPAAPTTLYAGTRGGLFASDNAGGAWRLLKADLNVRAIVVAADNRDTLYVGTERDWGLGQHRSRRCLGPPQHAAHERQHSCAPGTPRDS